MRADEIDNVLWMAHQQTVLRTARRLLRREEDAKDAAQEALMRLLKGHKGIRGDPWRAWLYRVTVNICNDHFRRIKRTVELTPQTSDPAPDPECRLRRKDRERLFWEGLNTLTQRERAVVLLYIKGYSAAEAGAVLPLPGQCRREKRALNIGPRRGSATFRGA
jgi:RNA polymerase sigma-70 factor (ECF subfamily)